MVSEDFSEFGRTVEHVPICMFRLGAIPAKTITESERTGMPLVSLHSGKFAPDAEPAIKTGITAMTAATLERWRRRKNKSMRRLLVGLMLGLSLPVVRAETPATAATEVTAVLTAQAAAWNRGDIDAFMAGYAPLADLRISHPAAMSRAAGESASERYQKELPGSRHDGRADVLRVRGHRARAGCSGRLWPLGSSQREKDAPHGFFTLTFRKFPKRLEDCRGSHVGRGSITSSCHVRPAPLQPP